MAARPTWPPRQAAEQELRLAEQRLARTPGSADARLERARLLDRLGRPEVRDAYLAVLAIDPAHRETLLRLGALLAATGFTTAARTVLARAVDARPDDANARTALGHLLRAAGETDAARGHYEAALRSDPAQPEAHQGLSYLLDGIDEAAAEHHRTLGFTGRALTTRPFRGTHSPVRVLQLVSARGGNVPTAALLDDATFLTHSIVAEYAAPGLALPPHDLVFNAIGDAERCGIALRHAAALLARTDAPVINPPARITPTTRAGNAALGRLEGVTTPRIATLPRAALAPGLPAGFPCPVLLRSPGYHTGQNFVRLENAGDLDAALRALPGDTLTLIEPLDARGADGAWRKYRIMLVGGAILPLHLAISPQWKVHHFTADMHDRPAHREEEAAFLGNMAGVLGAPAIAALRRIGDALALDYGGIDFALGPRGEVLLFEANATMTVAMPPADPVWSYRRSAVADVLEAVRALLLGRARPGRPERLPVPDRPQTTREDPLVPFEPFASR
ncbi:MAG: tetratricopeptide repeat protein [Janthinobacterium lividum]